MFKYEEIVLERVSALYSPASSFCCFFPLALPPVQPAPPAFPHQLMGEVGLCSPLSPEASGGVTLAFPAWPCSTGRGGLAAPPTTADPSRREGGGASPSPPSFTPSPAQTHQHGAGGRGSLSLPLPENGGAGSSAHAGTWAGAPHSWAWGTDAFPPPASPSLPGTQPGDAKQQGWFSSKPDRNGGSCCSSLFLSVGNTELMVCTTLAMAKISSSRG